MALPDFRREAPKVRQCHNFLRTYQKTGYSPETLGCLSEDLMSGTLDAARGKECIETTLTLREKLWVYLSAQSITYAIDNLLDNKEFLGFIKQGAVDETIKSAYKNKDKEALLDIFYPPQTNSITDAAASIVGRKLLKMSMDSGMPQFLLKDMFLGLNYMPQTEKLTEFLERENMDVYTLLMKVQSFAKKF